jgi:glycerol-3-phosphate O-acyltransferase
MHPLAFAAPAALPARCGALRHAAACTRAPPRATASPPRVAPVGRDAVRVADGLTLAARARKYVADGRLPAGAADVLASWADNYAQQMALSEHVDGRPAEFAEAMFTTLLEVCTELCERPLPFDPYHVRVREPFDYYKFGLEFTTSLIDIARCKVLGQEHLRRARTQVAAGENVVFLANHQSEGDPYAIDVLFDWIAGMDREFCESIVFMAGDRVRDDPVVAPFSVGRNLLTVYSKKHINDVPSMRGQKLKHNNRTIAQTVSLFKRGGTTVWFAPSGGRDRRSLETGLLDVSPFDPDAIDLMRMCAKKAGTPTHFYPMALITHDMLPPPSTVGGANLGEQRMCKYTPIHMALDEEIDWNALKAATKRLDKDSRRRVRCEYIEERVRQGYEAIGGLEI